MKFGSFYKFKDKMDLIQKVLDLYIITTPDASKLIVREKEALSYYIIYGYSSESVEDIKTALSNNIKSGYVRTINNSLRNKGYLIQDTRNMRNNHLSKEMEQIRKYYVENDGKLFMVGFLREQ